MLFPTKNRKKEATGKCRQHTVSLIFRWSQMNLCKQNYKLPHVNKKQEICPSHIHSPELASGAFLKWVLIQKWVPRRTTVTVAGQFLCHGGHQTVRAWSYTRKIQNPHAGLSDPSSRAPSTLKYMKFPFPWKMGDSYILEEKTRHKRRKQRGSRYTQSRPVGQNWGIIL